MNKSKFVILATFGVLTLFISQCVKDDSMDNFPVDLGARLSMDMKAMVNGNQEITRGEMFQVANDYDFLVSDLKFYVSQMQFQNTEGEWVSASPNVELLDIRDLDSTDYHIFLAPGDYVAVRYLFGLDSVMNRTNPASDTLDISHPLSAYRSTHWNWNLLYRFAIVEGRVNTYGNFITDPNSPVQNTLFSIHPGTDDMRVEKQQTFTNTLSIDRNGSNPTVVFIVDINTWFDGSGGVLDAMTENQGHAEPHDYHITKKFGENFADALSIEIQ
ncbi:MAG: hypothetical protein JJU02_06330 [Cryomorphaceae bacterium]|nr:hypothetical protein [Cryomorphaceae bacterium]